MTDEEIKLFVKAFLLPPPCGFTEYERKQILAWLKEPPFIELAKRKLLLDKKS